MAFWGYSDDATHPQCIIISVAPYMKVFSEKFDRPGVAIKQSKLKPISQCFKRS